MKKVLCLLILLIGLGWGKQALATEWKAYTDLYATYVDFQGSEVKDNAWSFTGYLAFKDGYNHALEFGLAQTHVNYKNEQTITQTKKKNIPALTQEVNDLDQTDFTFVYTNINQLLRNHIFKFGFHYINSDDELTDQGKIFYFQASYYQPYTWNAGVELAYSIYNNSAIDLNVIQIRPHFGLYFGFFGKRFYTESRLYYIHSDEVIGSSLKNCYSFEQMLSTFVGKADFMVSGWIGQQIFAVKNEGFVVYNLADKYLGGLAFEAGYKLTDNLRGALNITQEWLQHVEYGDKAAETIFTLSLGGSF